MLYVFISIVGMAAGILVHGWAISVMWEWFVVPVFDAPVLTMVNAIGLSFLAAIFSNVSNGRNEESDKSTLQIAVEEFLSGVFYTLGCVAFGFVFHLFM